MSAEKRPWKNAPGAPVDHDGDYWGFADATGIIDGYVEVSKGDGQYPSMVELSLSDDGTILPDDARAYGMALIEAADRCEQIDVARFTSEEAR
jgi:hypothetical protein